jgi:hypothetical protein
MPNNDTISNFADTLQVLPDSLTRFNDSIQASENIAAPDTVVAEVLRGFEGIARATHPSSENWVFLIVLLQFVLLSFVFARSYGWLIGSVVSFFKVKERESLFSKTTIIDVQSRIILLLFALSVYSFLVLLLLMSNLNEFNIEAYGKIFAVSLLFLLFKYVISIIVGFVFTQPVDMKNARKGYADAFNLLAVTLYPFLLIRLYADIADFQYLRYFALVFVVLAILLFIIKLFQIFYQKIVTSFYILLYLCTLEIIPFVVLFQVYKLVISNV